MAKLCKECSSAVDDNEILCPNCGAVLLDIGSKTGNKAGVLDTNVNNLPHPMPSDKQQPASPPASAESVRSSGGGTVLARAEKREAPLNAVSPTEPSKDASEMTQPVFAAGDSVFSSSSAPVQKRNALESSLGAAPRSAHKNRSSSILIVVVVLAILALFAAIVTMIILPAQQHERDQADIISYLQGSWVSDEFAFTDSTEKYVEVLVIDESGNFEMIHAIPDQAYPNGWEDGMWEIEDEISGRIDYIVEEKRLLLLYEEDGGNYFYDRTFIVKEEDTMCLREYYDESQSTYYDANFHRA